MAEADSNEDIMTATPQNSLQLAQRDLLGWVEPVWHSASRPKRTSPVGKPQEATPINTPDFTEFDGVFTW
jgi:hypothetical protein